MRFSLIKEVTEEILMEILKGQKWYKENDF